MLRRARAAQEEGIDVVIGLAETHGRRETEELMAGLEVSPRRKVEHQGRIIEEFDIDAAVARRPKQIIVDELTHTNAPIEGPWGTSERLLVCVGADSSSQKVVRAAARLATGLNAPWVAVHVVKSGEDEVDAEAIKQISTRDRNDAALEPHRQGAQKGRSRRLLDNQLSKNEALHLAERSGGQIERLSGTDLAARC